MWNTGCLPLRGVARNPVNFQLLPMACLPSVSARLPNATALIATDACLGCPASETSDSCSRLKSRAGNPAGVYRRPPAAAIRALRTSWFTPGGGRLRLVLRLLRLAGLFALDGPHHRRRAGIGFLALHGQVAQHGIIEAERMFQFG